MKRAAVALLLLFALGAACGSPSRQAEAGDGQASGADACTAGKQRYGEHRAQLLAKLAANACQADTECGVLWENNGCVNSCGVSVRAADREAAAQELEAFAKVNCGACAPIPTPPCAPPGPRVCKQGQCSEG